MATKVGKKGSGANRIGSATAFSKEASSLATSSASQEKRTKVFIWPEWNDADVNSEKWDLPHKGKDDKKGKSPTVPQHLYEDPDGRLELPTQLHVSQWKRPQDFINDKTPVVVDSDHMAKELDLTSPNDHLYESELMRYIVCQITTLWELSISRNVPDNPDGSMVEEDMHTWRPWEHIYSLCKVLKHHIPLYNVHGKYIVRVYWMGCWRKLFVDDLMPFDENDQLLLPVSSLSHELWPMLLSKALIKVASLDYTGGNPGCEFGDISVLHCLTGWLPEAIPLQRGYAGDIWKLLKTILPEWKLPDVELEKSTEAGICVSKDGSTQVLSETGKGDKGEITAAKDVKSESKDRLKDGFRDKPSREKGKELREDKKEKKEKFSDKEKEKSRERSVDEASIPDKPEVVVFARFGRMATDPVKVSLLGEMADASERLRQNGLSHSYPHPVRITQTRSCSLEPPPVPDVIPAWKLIRPKKRRETPSDEPRELPVVSKEIMCLEMASSFVNFRVSTVPIPTNTFPVRSPLDHCGTRSRPLAASVDSIEEADEDAPVEDITKVKSSADIQPQILLHDDLPKSTLADEGGFSGAKMKGVVSQKQRTSAKKDRSFENVEIAEKHVSKTGSTRTERRSGRMRDGSALKREDSDDKKHRDRDNKLAHPHTDVVGSRSSASSFAGSNSEGHNLTAAVPLNPALQNTGIRRPTMADLRENVGLDDSKCQSKHDCNASQRRKETCSCCIMVEWGDRCDERKMGKSKESDKDHEKDPTGLNNVFTLEGPTSREPRSPVTAGTLTVEPYSWKCLVNRQPIIRLSTTGTRATVISLPPGRHVLRFTVTSPLAHHVHMCSTVSFVFGDEDSVMSHLTSESCRLRETAHRVINCIGECVASFSVSEKFYPAWNQLSLAHCPYLLNKQVSKRTHFQIFNEALYGLLRKVLRETTSPDVAFAWHSLTFDPSFKNILDLPLKTRPATGSTSTRSSGKPGSKKPGEKGGEGRVNNDADKLTEHVWLSRYVEPTYEEQIAAIKIQKVWRGYWVIKVKRARCPGTKENLKAKENLTKSWSIIEQNCEENGLFLLREMFRRDPTIAQFHPFYDDEWNKISYADYRGVIPDQPAHTWFVVFREVFYVREEVMAVPKLTVPISTCVLHVIDNDTGCYLPSVFHKVSPYLYTPNKKGYTFVAEGRTVEQALMMSSAWRLRLIGSQSPLPSPRGSDVNSLFQVMEIRDYYVPNNGRPIVSYTVRVAEDQVASVQMATSKEDVLVRLVVLDRGKEIASLIGKGHVVIQAVLFHKDCTSDDSQGTNSNVDTKRSSSRTSNRGTKGKSRHADLVKSPDGRASRGSPNSEVASFGTDVDAKDVEPHKYLVQASVLRDTWPLSASNWAFVQQLKEREKSELKVAYKDRPPSPTRSEKVTAVGQKGKPKVKTDKSTKERQDSKGSSRPPSQQFDVTKAHWTVRIVVDAATVDDIEVKKDTERSDEIRAIKKAWEEAEPGRAAKAVQSRLKYLTSHTVNLQADEEVRDVGEDGGKPLESKDMTKESVDDASTDVTAIRADNEVSNRAPSPPPPREILRQLDLTLFVRKTLDQPVFLDEEQVQRQLEERQKEIADYRELRKQVEAWRLHDRIYRNNTKIYLVDNAQSLQTALDILRESINIPREAYRQRHLEAERRKLEELALQETETKVETELKTDKGLKPGKGKISGKNKK